MYINSLYIHYWQSRLNKLLKWPDYIERIRLELIVKVYVSVHYSKSVTWSGLPDDGRFFHIFIIRAALRAFSRVVFSIRVYLYFLLYTL